MIASEKLVTYMWILLAVYAAVILYFVIRGAKKNTSIKDYAVGNIGFSPWVVGLSLAASMTSAATFIINPGFIALYGISGVISFALVLPIAAFISLIVFTKGFVKQGNAVKATTMAQWIGKRYKSKSYAFFFGVIALLLITFIVLINVGLTQVISKSLNADPFYVLLAITAFVFGYMMFGGANSMVYTNTIQAIIMFIVAIILISSGSEYFSDGITGFFDKLNTIDSNLTKPTNASSFLFRDYFEIIVTQIIIGVAIVCQPHIITKSLLLKDSSKINSYLFSGIAFMIVFFLVVVVGLYARISFPDLMVNGEALRMDEIIPTYVVTKFSVGVGLVIVVGLISAGLSTLESLIQSLSITITSDIINPLFKDKFTEKTITINKMVIVILAVVSFLLSWQQIKSPNVSVAIFAQNGVYAYFAAAFVPVLFGTFLNNVSTRSASIASITAIVVHFGIYYGRITPYMQEPVNNPGVSAAMGIVASLVVGYIIYKLDSKKELSGSIRLDS
ncbi:sodium:solute symporter [Lacinutrix sp. C3R15]|uniref:sodium:solute symporter family transporter n=1 Tax=Flavobacteriaceae TaxID=49546 RepID=UPI001C085397|nr:MULTISPECIES: sodium:solute symporter [Flavobacteriaceae]MBU2938996.1 sodium:solute symporter [Lacinutrix sp. C3R15]MDO6622311.1 sodium:solute symporter [Oceanihabitans sp. 1_MG-2023]